MDSNKRKKLVAIIGLGSIGDELQTAAVIRALKDCQVDLIQIESQSSTITSDNSQLQTFFEPHELNLQLDWQIKVCDQYSDSSCNPLKRQKGRVKQRDFSRNIKNSRRR